MPRFAVHRNRNAATKSRYPLLVDVQSDLLEELSTRVVIPLTPASTTAKRTTMQTLTPVCIVEGKEYLLVTPQLAGIAVKELGPSIGDLTQNRQAILSALDLLLTGI
jgi:toxin CcdB